MRDPSIFKGSDEACAHRWHACGLLFAAIAFLGRVYVVWYGQHQGGTGVYCLLRVPRHTKLL